MADPSDSELPRTPHAFEHHSQYDRLRTEGPAMVGGNADLTTLTHQQALVLLYAEELTRQTHLSHRQAQAWTLRRYGNESRQSIAALLGVQSPTVDEYLTEAERKADRAQRFVTLYEFAERRYFDYPNDGRPTLPVLLTEASWTHEHRGDDRTPGVVRHFETYRWFADATRGGTYHIETVDRQKRDSEVATNITSTRFQSFEDAIETFYVTRDCDSLREAVVRWTVVRDVCAERTDGGDPPMLPVPTAVVKGDVDVGELLDFVDEGRISVREAEAFATPMTDDGERTNIRIESRPD